MKIDKNVLSIMEEMLAEPEKDWSNHLPFMKLTEEDFVKAEKLIKKHINFAEYREDALEKLEEWKTNYAIKGFGYTRYWDYIRFLKQECVYRKRQEKSTEIQNEINACFETQKFSEIEQEVFDLFDSMFMELSNSRVFHQKFLNYKKEIEESFDFEKASEFLKEEN